MADATIHVKGLRELQAALKAVDAKAGKEFGDALKRAAEPVVMGARARLERFRGASLGTVRARRSGVRVYVEQSKAKTTGKRPDFGALQMRTALIPALDEQETHVFDAIDSLIGEWSHRF